MLLMGVLRKKEAIGSGACVLPCSHIFSRMLSHESIDAANEFRNIISPIGRLLGTVQQFQWTLRCIDGFPMMDADFLERNNLVRVTTVYVKPLRRLRSEKFAVRARRPRKQRLCS